MATSGELIRITARALQLPESTVTSYHRMLRQGGLLTKGGRGRSAPDVSASDVARLLLALLGADALAEAVDITELLSDLISPTPLALHPTGGPVTLDGPDGLERIDVSTLSYDPQDDPVTLEEATVRLLSQAQVETRDGRSESSYVPFIGWIDSEDVALSVIATNLTAEIRIADRSLEFFRPEGGTVIYPDDWMSLPIRDRLIARAELDGVEIRRSVNFSSLRELSKALPSP